MQEILSRDSVFKSDRGGIETQIATDPSGLRPVFKSDRGGIETSQRQHSKRMIKSFKSDRGGIETSYFTGGKGGTI